MSLEQQQAPAGPTPIPPAKTRRKKPPQPDHCLNCGAAATGNFCAKCGQEIKYYTVSLGPLLSDLLSEVASWDSKLFRTLVPLLIRPGFLTNEYNAGRRVPYLSPLKLYLTVSVLFFLVLPLTRSASLAKVDMKAPANAQKTLTAAQAQVKAANTQIKTDKDYQEMQADLKDSLADSPPGIIRLGTSSPAISPSDFTHLPKTLEDYDAQQRDPRRLHDAKPVQFLKRQVIKVRQNPQSLSAALLNDIPKMMFIMLPAFALSLKLLYLRSRRLYIEHLVFSLHLHALLFLLLTLLLGVQAALPHASFAGPAVTVAALLYVYLAMRTVYKQSWGKTLVKYSLLAFNYAFLVSFTLLGAAAVAFAFV